MAKPSNNELGWRSSSSSACLVPEASTSYLPHDVSLNRKVVIKENPPSSLRQGFLLR